MTKSDLVKKLRDKMAEDEFMVWPHGSETLLKPKIEHAKYLVDAVFDFMAEALRDADDGQMKVDGFGNFKVKTVKKDAGATPDGRKLSFVTGRKVKFSQSSMLLDTGENETGGDDADKTEDDDA